MTDLSNMTLDELDAEKRRALLKMCIAEARCDTIDAEIERRKAEPDYAAWEPKWQAFEKAMEWPDQPWGIQRKEWYLRALIAAHNTPLAGEEGWIPWTGGECPVLGDTLVAVKLRGQGESRATREGATARHWYWIHKGSPSDITAYRVVKEP